MRSFTKKKSNLGHPPPYPKNTIHRIFGTAIHASARQSSEGHTLDLDKHKTTQSDYINCNLKHDLTTNILLSPCKSVETMKQGSKMSFILYHAF